MTYHLYTLELHIVYRICWVVGFMSASSHPRPLYRNLNEVEA